ncbi:MAG: hypothetical protein WD599_03460, partial [Balneolaceae bacterium]
KITAWESLSLGALRVQKMSVLWRRLCLLKDFKSSHRIDMLRFEICSGLDSVQYSWFFIGS